jgi:cobalt-zinc-cadmium efflux system outer membrane protein
VKLPSLPRFITALILLSSSPKSQATEPTAPGSTARTTVTAPPLDLARAVRLALDSNPSLRASAARVDAASGRSYQARRWPNPQLELSAEEWPVDRGNGLQDALQMAGVSQVVPWPGKKPLDGRMGDAGVRIAQAEWELRRRELVRDVKVAFWESLAMESMLEVAGELLEVARLSAETARKRVEAGAAADQEQLRAEVPLEQARTVRAGYERDHVAARERLAALLGHPELRAVPLLGAFEQPSESGLLDQPPAGWLAHHPILAGARTTLEQTHLADRRARLEPYPDLTLGLAGGRDGSSDASIVQFRVSVPLPILDRSRGRRQEARAHVNVSEAELASLEQGLLRDWGTLRQRVLSASAEVAIYRDRIMPKAGEALRLVRAGFEQGKFGLIDLIDTQRTWAEVRLTYRQRLLALHAAHAELEALIGPPVPASAAATPPATAVSLSAALPTSSPARP